jgi:glycosyltransferase involved in cell wall biosynthesis
LASNKQKSKRSKDEQIRLCIVNEFFYPDNGGGTGSVLSDLTKTLRASYPQLKIDAVTSRNLYRDKDVVLPEFEDWDDVSIYRVKTSHSAGLSAAKRIIINTVFGMRALRTLLKHGPYDAILIGTAPPTLAMIARLYKRLTGVPYTYIIYDLDPDRAVTMGVLAKGSLVEKVLRWAQRGWLKSADKVVVLGRCMQDYISNAYKLPKNHFEVIPIGADPDEIVPLSKDTKLREKHNLTGFVVSYSGNFGRYHNFDTILDAAKKLQALQKDVTFLLIGGGAKRDYIASRIESEELKNVLLLPFLPKEDYSDSLSSADASLVTLEPGMEGLCVPSKFYSILASGRPVLAMVGASCEVGRVVIEANCGYRIDQTDIDGLVDAVLYLAENLDEADKLGKNARKVLVEKYSTQKIADRYLQVIANSAHYEIDLLQDNNEDISEKSVSAGV